MKLEGGHKGEGAIFATVTTLSIMLVRKGPFNEEELVDACRTYLSIRGRKEDSVCEIPYRDGDKGGKVFFVRFTWLAEQWVYTDIVEAPPKRKRKK